MDSNDTYYLATIPASRLRRALVGLSVPRRRGDRRAGADAGLERFLDSVSYAWNEVDDDGVPIERSERGKAVSGERFFRVFIAERRLAEVLARPAPRESGTTECEDAVRAFLGQVATDWQRCDQLTAIAVRRRVRLIGEVGE